MKNNIPATKVFWYRHGTGFQAYQHEILYMTFCTGQLIKNLHWPLPNETIIYRQLECFGTGTEPDFKHTSMTLCTGMLIKNLHLPVQN